MSVSHISVPSSDYGSQQYGYRLLESVNRNPAVIAFRTLARSDLDRGSTSSALGKDGGVRPASELRQEVCHAKSGLWVVRWSSMDSGPYRAQRQAGVTKYEPTTEEVKIAPTRKAYEQHGWKEFSATVFQELIHAWQYHELDDASHGTIHPIRTSSPPRSTTIDYGVIRGRLG